MAGTGRGRKWAWQEVGVVGVNVTENESARLTVGQKLSGCGRQWVSVSVSRWAW